MRRKYHSKRKLGTKKFWERKKSLFKRGIFWSFLLGFCFVSGLIYFFFFSPFFQLKEIIISGDEGAPIEEIKSMIEEKSVKKLAFFDFKNILFLNLKGIENFAINKFPEIAKLTLKKQFPDILAAQIEERKPVAIYCGEGDCYFIDKEGVIFEKISPYSDNYSVVRLENNELKCDLGKQIIETEKISQIIKIDSKFKKVFKIGINEIILISQKRINVKTSEGWEAYFNPSKDIDLQLDRLDAVLKEKFDPKKRAKIQYIDLRFDKIYIFPEGT